MKTYQINDRDVSESEFFEIVRHYIGDDYEPGVPIGALAVACEDEAPAIDAAWLAFDAACARLLESMRIMPSDEGGIAAAEEAAEVEQSIAALPEPRKSGAGLLTLCAEDVRMGGRFGA